MTILKTDENALRVAIMQPYFFPYIGYWQLFNAVDKFVILDDVNYIKRGYINSNSIIVNGGKYKFTISIEKPSQNKMIKDTKLYFLEKERNDLLKTIEMAYKKAKNFDAVYSILEEIILYSENDLTKYIKNSLEVVARYLGIETSILVSSEIDKDNTLKAEKRIIEINKHLGSDIYINPIGGQSLYNSQTFSKEGIQLHFIKTKQIEYKQFTEEFIPNLSFIDVLMHNNKQDTFILLSQYELI